MNDLEILFCAYRGQVDSLIEQLERIARDDIPGERRRAILGRLLAAVAEELAGAGARWTPSYDAVLRDVLAARAALESVVSGEEPPRNEHGCHHHGTGGTVGRLRARLLAHAHVLELLERSPGPMPSDAWEACEDPFSPPFVPSGW